MPRDRHIINPPEQRTAYELDVPELVAPDLPGDVIAIEDADELIDRVAAELVLHAENCVRQFGDFHLALSGGPLQEPLYERLMYDPNYRRLPWRRVHLWIVDEPSVPFGDDRSRFRMIDETIVDHSGIPAEQVHPIYATNDEADVQYTLKMQEILSFRPKGHDRLDYVLLNAGAEGDVAGLFPGTQAVREPVKPMRINVNETGDPPRWVTMTLPIINAARLIAVLITGSESAHVVKRLSLQNENAETLPVAGIRPMEGELRWYLDGPACRTDEKSELDQ